MKTKALLLVAAIVLLSVVSYAQVPVVSSLVKLDIGIGGGASLPLGDLSNMDNTGYHFGAKVKLHGFMPLNVIGTGNYNRLANKVGSESDTQIMIGAGLEYPLPSVIVHPYFSGEALMNMLSNTAAGSQSRTRFGAAVGGGVAFSVPAFGDIDASVKYQMFNLVGKDANETTLSQAVANVVFMFSIL